MCLLLASINWSLEPFFALHFTAVACLLVFLISLHFFFPFFLDAENWFVSKWAGEQEQLWINNSSFTHQGCCCCWSLNSSRLFNENSQTFLLSLLQTWVYAHVLQAIYIESHLGAMRGNENIKIEWKQICYFPICLQLLFSRFYFTRAKSWASKPSKPNQPVNSLHI